MKVASQGNLNYQIIYVIHESAGVPGVAPTKAMHHEFMIKRVNVIKLRICIIFIYPRVLFDPHYFFFFLFDYNVPRLYSDRERTSAAMNHDE